MTKQEIYRFDRICKMCGKELSGAASNRQYCAKCAKRRHTECCAQWNAARKADKDEPVRRRKHESNLDRCIREADKLGMKYVEYMLKYRNDKFFSTQKIHISRNNVRRLKVN